jgi:hypothetical protein
MRKHAHETQLGEKKRACVDRGLHYARCQHVQRCAFYSHNIALTKEEKEIDVRK